MVADRYRNGHVDADHAGVGVPLELPGRSAVTGKYGRPVSERVVADHLHAIGVAVGANHGEDRSEDLVGVDAHVGSHVVKQCHAEEEAVAVEGLVSTVDDHLASGIGTGLNIASNPVSGLPGDQRPHLGPRVGARTDDQFLHTDLDGVHQLVANVADGHDDRDGHAPFSR